MTYRNTNKEHNTPHHHTPLPARRPTSRWAAWTASPTRRPSVRCSKWWSTCWTASTRRTQPHQPRTAAAAGSTTAAAPPTRVRWRGAGGARGGGERGPYFICWGGRAWDSAEAAQCWGGCPWAACGCWACPLYTSDALLDSWGRVREGRVCGEMAGEKGRRGLGMGPAVWKGGALRMRGSYICGNLPLAVLAWL